jgi:RNA polymerase sigma-70 factor, ECF subfamily
MNGNEVDNATIKRAAEGNHDVFKHVYEAYKDRVLNLTFYMLGNEYQAHDVTQEIFIKLFTSLDQFRYESEFSTWVYRLAINACTDHIRKEKKRRATVALGQLESDSIMDYASDSMETLVHRNQLNTEVENAIQALSPKLRSAVILRHINGLSYDDISRILDCSVGTVSSRLYRGYKSLGKKLMHLKADI